MQGLVVGLGILFLAAFIGMTIAALAEAEPTIGSVITFGLAFLVIVLVAIGLIGASRNPPDD